MNRLRILSLVLIALLGTATRAVAEPRIEIEVDPIAYALKGYSLHGAVAFTSSRLDFGIYGMSIPQQFLGTTEFTQSFNGVGLNWDYFGRRFSGLFAGAGIGLSRNKIVHSATEARFYQNQFGAGIRIGYRISGEQLFVSPWLGISHAFGASDITVGEDHYNAPAIQLFPTIHFGVRF